MTIHLKPNGYTPKFPIEYLKNINAKKASIPLVVNSGDKRKVDLTELPYPVKAIYESVRLK